MHLTRREALAAGLGLAFLPQTNRALAQAADVYPPPLKGAKDGTATLQTDDFLAIPESVQKASKLDGAPSFTVAKVAPTVDLAYHGDLGPDAKGRRLWSSWGDIGLASDGRVYSGIGDHANDQGGDARCFIYQWDPKLKQLKQVVDMNRVIPKRDGQPAWSKVHAKIDEGHDNKIYFSCTLNDGNRAVTPKYGWTDRLPGGQIYCFDPAANQTTVAADLPRPRCTATSLFDRERKTWWCTLEGGGNALWAVNLETKKPVYQGMDGSVVFNRAVALLRDGSILYNGEKGSICRADPAKGQATTLKSSFDPSPGMRSATRESRDGVVYGTTYRTGELYRYRPARDELTLHGPAWVAENYVTVCELSPDEKFLYYLPGAHGGAMRTGTPVIQYEIASGRRKVIAFLRDAFEKAQEYVPAGTYGIKISADGSTLFVNFNGHAATEAGRPKHVKPIGFGLCSFAAIHIPAAER